MHCQGSARLDQFGRWANWFSDPDLFDCPECEDLGRPYAAAAAADSYGRGYDQGKDTVAGYEGGLYTPTNDLLGQQRSIYANGPARNSSGV